jgi:hypothetical protein
MVGRLFFPFRNRTIIKGYGTDSQTKRNRKDWCADIYAVTTKKWMDIVRSIILNGEKDVQKAIRPSEDKIRQIKHLSTIWGEKRNKS